MTTVATLLSNKPRPFNFVEPGTKVENALHLLGAINMSYLVVMHDNSFKGIFCEHDFCHNVALRGWDPKVCLVEDTMSHSMPSVTPEDTLEKCVHLFNAHKIRYLPVFDKSDFAGIITHGDVLRAMLKSGKEVFDNPEGNAENPEWYGNIV